jgi:hypothetical protein
MKDSGVKSHFPLRCPPPAVAGVLCLASGLAIYFAAIVLSLVRLLVAPSQEAQKLVATLLWWSGMPSSIGLMLIALDLFFFFPQKRRHQRRTEVSTPNPTKLTVALMAYNDVESIGPSVKDFLSHPLVSTVIVVDNNSSDGTAVAAAEAGARVVIEKTPGYGSCAYRCLTELLHQGDTDFVVLCEGDMTFRARDLEKLAAMAVHADIVNGTRIVEQLRDYNTQLSTFMYYGNFFVGKLLEIKHLGHGTFTDVGTTYKLLRRAVLPELLEWLNPAVNLEFNAHFMDRALFAGLLMIECPITFHARVGRSKGGNINNLRALHVGLRMISGLLTDWRFAAQRDVLHVPVSVSARGSHG